jgi:hypothetical protein
LTYRAAWPSSKPSTPTPLGIVSLQSATFCGALTNGCTIGSIATAGRYGRGRKREARYRLDLRRDITRINEYAFWRLVDPVLWLTIPKLLRRFQWNYTRAGLEITLHNTFRRATPKQITGGNRPTL